MYLPNVGFWTNYEILINDRKLFAQYDANAPSFPPKRQIIMMTTPLGKLVQS